MSARNTLQDLNNHLFEALENLQMAESDEELKKEERRSRSVTNVASKIIDNANLMLQARKHYDITEGSNVAPRIFIGNDSDV